MGVIQSEEDVWVPCARILLQKMLQVKNTTILLKSKFTKKCFGKTHRILLHACTNTQAHTKTFVCEVLENNYCFLSLSCSSFYSIVFFILDLFWFLNLKKHKHFPASLVFLIHTLRHTFPPICTVVSGICR